MINELFKTEQVRIGDLVPHVKNPRKIKAAEKQKLWERIQKYGMIGIPVRDADNSLLSGNRRCEVIVQQGLGDMLIDVRTAVRKLTDEELREVMIIENTHAGEWDLEMLKQEFDDLVDLESYGISHEELDRQIEEATEQLEEAPELPVVAKFSEKYDSIVIICRNEIDMNHLSEKLGLDRVQCYKSSKVGMQHVVDAKQVIEVLSK
jgi:DNA-directed RNA polymerase